MKSPIMWACLWFFACLMAVQVPAHGFDKGRGQERFEVRIENLDQETRLALQRMNALDGIWGTTARAYLTESQIEAFRKQGVDLELVPHPLTLNPGLVAGYHTFAELSAELQAIETAYPDLCQLYKIGNSVQGRAMWFMKISDNVEVEEDEPEFKYISSMHGDEVVGMELCMNLINLLTGSYGTDPQITQLVDEVEIWIMPLMNPDGYVNHSRYNANWVDLNRDFPDRVVDPVNTTAGRAIETANVMNWGFAHSPALSANFHGGALVVNYPYDSDPNPSATYSATPDDDLFIAQSLAYSTLNIPMYNSYYFPQGITNGLAWYEIYGGMQDWNYVWMGCNDVTIELDNDKWPAYSQIQGLWDDNRESMLAYMEWCLKGVRGVVTNSATGQPVAATVTVVDIDHEVYTDPDVGDYHRMLLPGTYTLRFSAYGYQTKDVPGVNVNFGTATRLDVAMDAAGSLIADRGELPYTGGTVEFTLMADSARAGRNYVLLGGVSGTSPGVPLPGGYVTLPLNWDVVTSLVLGLLNTTIFTDFMGDLDYNGNGYAVLNAPELPTNAIGAYLYFAYALRFPYDFASNPVQIEIVP